MLLCSWKSIQAQAPNLLSYQAVVRNASGSVVANQAVGMRVTLLRGSGSGLVERDDYKAALQSAGSPIPEKPGGIQPSRS